MENFYLRQNCRLCASPRVERVLDLGAVPIGDDFVTKEQARLEQPAFPLQLTVCRECGLVQVPGVVSPEAMYSNYLYETSSSLGLERHFQHYADSLVRDLAPKPGALAVDIGSNVGALLKGLQGHGLKVLGVDPAEAIARKATANGLETWCAFFGPETAKRIRAEKGPAGIITANNVMANIDDLTDLMAGIRELLADDGAFVFETGYMIDTIQNRVLDNVTHEHLCYFSILPLMRFFERQGLKLVDAQRIPTKGGSLRGVVRRAEHPAPVSDNVTGWATLERELGFEGLAPLKAFATQAETMKREVQVLLHGLKQKGKKIAGYGASIGATTLIYHLGVGGLLDCVYDDNPIKFNMFSPGLHLPVYDSAALYEHKPDYILNLAWRYIQPIQKRHERFLESGGRFISCLPTVEIMEPEAGK